MNNVSAGFQQSAVFVKSQMLEAMFSPQVQLIGALPRRLFKKTIFDLSHPTRSDRDGYHACVVEKQNGLL